ncbi:MAG: aldo/keto reductase [Actinomycetia bacterium]|nr:aldo/keto reductase [Actinomycetes bacterium]
MQYVQYGNTDLKVSRFGLGCMRFPTVRSEAVQMVRYAIDHGVNYLDTAYVYENSEDILGEALRDGYRQRTCLVSKLPLWNVESYSDMEQQLDVSLKRLNTDYLDVYLLHNLYQDNLDKACRLDGPGFLDEMIEKGKVRYKGFSMHNGFQAFQGFVDDYRWDMAQIQMNILDIDQQVGLPGLCYGAQRGLAMVVMESLRGGLIVKNAPAAVAGLLAAYPEQRSLVEWCLRWLYDMPEATVILSGTSTLEQLQDNLRIFEQAASGVMSEADSELIARIREAFKNEALIGCTGCRYCQPCPQTVAIPEIFSLYNAHKMTGSEALSDKVYYRNGISANGHGARECVECGECEKLCPQGLPIPGLLKTIDAELASGLPDRFLHERE